MNERYVIRHQPGSIFACVNSGRGFRSYLEGLTADLRFLYHIKGGPGTGKSRTLFRLAAEAERRGERALLVRCSSDPQSLDGLILPDRKIGLFDATAPHSSEPTLPGVDGKLVDQGAFLDPKKLAEHRAELEKLSAAKKRGYANACRLLSAAGEAQTAANETLLPFFDEKKAEKEASKLQKALCSIGKPAALPLPDAQKNGLFCPMKALSMTGAFLLDGFENAGTVWTVKPFLGGETLLTAALARAVKASGLSFLVSPDPVTLSPDSLFFPEGFCLRVGQPLGRAGERVLRASSFFSPDRDCRAAAKRLHGIAEDAVSAALCALSEASAAHFALERRYGEAMNFSGADELCARLMLEVFSA